MQQPKKIPSRKTPLAVGLLGIAFILLAGAMAALSWRPKDTPSAGAEPAPEGNCATAVTVDYPAPELNLINLESQRVSLQDHQGDVLLVNTWATWCPPCRAEMPVLEQYYQAHREQGFEIIGIDVGEASSVVHQFVQAQGLSFPIWLDEEKISLRAFRSISLPSSFIIDRQGNVRSAWQGATCLKQLEADVTPLLFE